jgi:hypothetical protein
MDEFEKLGPEELELPYHITTVMREEEFRKAVQRNFDVLAGHHNRLFSLLKKVKRRKKPPAQEHEDDENDPLFLTGVTLDFDKGSGHRHHATHWHAIVRCDEQNEDDIYQIKTYEFKLRPWDPATNDFKIYTAANTSDSSKWGTFMPARRCFVHAHDDDADTIAKHVFVHIRFRSFYRASVRAITKHGHKGPWSGTDLISGHYWTAPGTPSDTNPPPDPTASRLIVRQHHFHQNWDQPNDPDDSNLIHPDIAYAQTKITTSSSSSASPMVVNGVTYFDRYVHAHHKNWPAFKPGAGSYYGWVRNVDASGNISAWIGSGAVTRSDPPTPSTPSMFITQQGKAKMKAKVNGTYNPTYNDDDIEGIVIDLAVNGDHRHHTFHIDKDTSPPWSYEMMFHGIEPGDSCAARVKADAKHNHSSAWSGTNTQTAGSGATHVHGLPSFSGSDGGHVHPHGHHHGHWHDTEHKHDADHVHKFVQHPGHGHSFGQEFGHSHSFTSHDHSHGVSGTSGGASTGTAHTHGAGSYTTDNDSHMHSFASAGGHDHGFVSGGVHAHGQILDTSGNTEGGTASGMIAKMLGITVTTTYVPVGGRRDASTGAANTVTDTNSQAQSTPNTDSASASITITPGSSSTGTEI